jgi:AraC-like DNA-binding protein
MKYVSKQLNDTLRVTGIVNLHFFEFDNDFATVGERHPFYELVFVNSGKLCISSEDYTGELYKNQLIIHRQNTEHSLRCPTDEAPSVIIIGFECDSELIDRFSRKPTEPEPSVVRQLAEIVKEGRNVFRPPYDQPVYDMKKKKHQPEGSEQLLRILLESFLIRLMRGHSESESDEKRADAPLMIQELIRYVNANYREKITIDELAFLFNTNRATLCKEFKRTTGKTVIGYVNDKKYEKAKKMIIDTNDTFTHIAQELNFESIHYFTRFFKKMSGMTPKDFRKLVSEKNNE